MVVLTQGFGCGAAFTLGCAAPRFQRWIDAHALGGRIFDSHFRLHPVYFGMPVWTGTLIAKGQFGYLNAALSASFVSAKAIIMKPLRLLFRAAAAKSLS